MDLGRDVGSCQDERIDTDPSSMDATAEAGIAEALDRIEDFIAVQGSQISVEAVNLLQESVGIDEETRAIFRDRVESLGPTYRPAPILLGVIVGLLAAQLEAERR
jgi:hypothetical protein